VQEFYHVQGERSGRMAAIVYRRVNNSKLFMNVSQVVVEIPNWKMRVAWTMLQNKGERTCLEFYLKD
jgi:hypothetical protein